MKDGKGKRITEEMKNTEKEDEDGGKRDGEGEING